MSVLRILGLVPFPGIKTSLFPRLFAVSVSTII